MAHNKIYKICVCHFQKYQGNVCSRKLPKESDNYLSHQTIDIFAAGGMRFLVRWVRTMSDILAVTYCSYLTQFATPSPPPPPTHKTLGIPKEWITNASLQSAQLIRDLLFPDVVMKLNSAEFSTYACQSSI